MTVWAERFGAQAADSPQAVLEAGLDDVVVAAATDAHPALILAAVDAGLPVFCEKPVAGRPKDALELLRRVSHSAIAVQIGYPRRFNAGFAAARAAVASGELGWLHTVRSTTLDPGPSATGLHRRLRRDLPRLQRPRLRRHQLDHRPRGRGGLRHRQRHHDRAP